MQCENVTTPFGRRGMTLALVQRQLETARAVPERSVDKWKVFRDICEAKERFGLQDRALAVLSALISFYPETVLSAKSGLVVFPSNAQLSIRAHGIAGTTLRRHLAVLVEAGLIERRDSPNGKRYARKSGSGAIEDAYGFSLAPLLARADELAHLAQDVAEERLQFKRQREALTLRRRDVRKLLSAAVAEAGNGEWEEIEQRYEALMAGLPRKADAKDIARVLQGLERLREEIVNRLENLFLSQKTDGNDTQNGAHIQDSHTQSIHEVEPCFETKPAREKSAEKGQDGWSKPAFGLSGILRACPQIADYGPGGAIGGWRDMLSAAIVVRSMLGISPAAYQDACAVMGAENAAIAVACILERAGHIQSHGGYLRNLTRKAERGEFSLGPMVMALMRIANMPMRASG